MRTAMAAAVQATPVFLDREATIEKACRLAKEAAAFGAELIVFPEAFVSGYPDWVWRSQPWKDATARYRRLLEASVTVGSPATEALAGAARDAGAYLCIGVNELDEAGGTLYNTLLSFSPEGEIVGRHRKLMPTGGERLVWGMGDGSTLGAFDTPFGRVGALTCWEQYMPLAKYAMYAQGIDILLAPTWDNGENWICTLRHNAREGRVFVIGVASVLSGPDVPADFPGRDGLYGGAGDWMCPGWSAIVEPGGSLLAGPLKEQEGILYAELDAGAARASRIEFDPVGHYARRDVFHLTVDTRPKPAVTSVTAPAPSDLALSDLPAEVV
jgi:nitrilase